MKKDNRLIGLSNQEELVIQFMYQNGSITSLQAFRYLSVTRLSAVIFNLKEKGFYIDKVFETNKKTKTHYARYYLVEKNGKRK